MLSVRPDLTWPADIYLEGGDQHRGWFQSSLLVGLGTRGRKQSGADTDLVPGSPRGAANWMRAQRDSSLRLTHPGN